VLKYWKICIHWLWLHYKKENHGDILIGVLLNPVESMVNWDRLFWNIWKRLKICSSKCPVKLLTEEIYSSKGSLFGVGGQNSLAAEFANKFTSVYEQVSQNRPIFVELENLFRFVALTNIIKYNFDNVLVKKNSLGKLMQEIKVAMLLQLRTSYLDLKH